ncbi:hypothetical protein Tco_0451931 [Tanacetum coccineum]
MGGACIGVMDRFTVEIDELIGLYYTFVMTFSGEGRTGRSGTTHDSYWEAEDRLRIVVSIRGAISVGLCDKTAGHRDIRLLNSDHMGLNLAVGQVTTDVLEAEMRERELVIGLTEREMRVGIEVRDVRYIGEESDVFVCMGGVSVHHMVELGQTVTYSSRVDFGLVSIMVSRDDYDIFSQHGHTL